MLGPNPQITIGHNKPPNLIDSAKDAMADLNAWLADNPVVQHHEQAKQGAAWVERSRIVLAEMDDERKALVEPLNTRLNAINVAYRVVREPFDKVLRELKRRLTDFASAEEAKRIAAAEAARKAAEEAERAAREAEAKEREAIQNANVGECAAVGEAIIEADARFADFQKAQRQAAVAERDVPVRLKSVLGGKALSMRTTEVLNITDTAKALKALGLTPKIKEAILSSAREYRREFNELPPGVEATYERGM